MQALSMKLYRPLQCAHRWENGGDAGLGQSWWALQMKGGVWHSTHRTGAQNSGAGTSKVVRGQCPTVPYWCLASAMPVWCSVRCSAGAVRGVQHPGVKNDTFCKPLQFFMVGLHTNTFVVDLYIAWLAAYQTVMTCTVLFHTAFLPNCKKNTNESNAWLTAGLSTPTNHLLQYCFQW